MRRAVTTLLLFDLPVMLASTTATAATRHAKCLSTFATKDIELTPLFNA
jgi:hypothetical protein